MSIIKIKHNLPTLYWTAFASISFHVTKVNQLKHPNKTNSILCYTEVPGFATLSLFTVFLCMHTHTHTIPITKLLVFTSYTSQKSKLLKVSWIKDSCRVWWSKFNLWANVVGELTPSSRSTTSTYMWACTCLCLQGAGIKGVGHHLLAFLAFFF